MSKPKPFQQAAVEAALECFKNSGGRRRFLVADEVGLGKTIVAREVARHLSGHGERPFVIYYIANGHAVSHQNKRRVVDFLETKRRKEAISTPDRLSLIALAKRPATAVVVYALTPATSLPGANARLTGGRKEERAFLKVLLEKVYPSLSDQLGLDRLRLNAGKKSWDDALAEAEAKLAKSPAPLRQCFRDALTIEFGSPVQECLRQAANGPVKKGGSPHKPTAFVGRLRRALALATLRQQPPDLVVLDEFQRYPYLIDTKQADPLVEALLEPREAAVQPCVLLLSATPYRLLATRWEEARGVLAHEQLLDLIQFLAGMRVRQRARRLFTDFGNTLRDIAAHRDVNDPALQLQVRAAAGLRDQLRRLLTPVMSRTERDGVMSKNRVVATSPLKADPQAEDFRIYRHLVDGFEKKMKYEALPYWSSVPLPAQSLGPRYAAWKKAKFAPAPNLTSMTMARRDELDAPAAWPEAKLRALTRHAPPRLLSLPWVAPSLAWWPLDGDWKRQSDDPKLLMFSRFRATPPSVAALLSFGVEAHALRGTDCGYEAYSRRKLKLRAKPGPLMTAFHPSPWLILNTNPLVRAGRPLKEVRAQVEKQIRLALPGVVVDKSTAKARRRHRPIAQILASIERSAGVTEQSTIGWNRAIGDDRAAKSAVRQWREAPPLDRLYPMELADLVAYAIGSPGVVLGRALWRHDPAILDEDRFPALVQLSWQGLRAYLDNPVFLSTLPGESAVEQIMRAVVDGCFESVLDEHCWLRAQNLPEDERDLVKDLRASLGLRAGSFSFQKMPGDSDKALKIPVRCHVAVPFGDAEAEPAGKKNRAGTKDDDGPARPDEVRKSFNTPFWPHVLTTTSVGQEGLDFHPWCARVVHWDIPSNPLDMEQREGRIQRFAGLAVRRQLARELRKEVLRQAVAKGFSPWRLIEELSGRCVDKTGLRPWWVTDHADIQRHVFERPFGRDISRFAQLQEQRMIYRLALGQPNQEDFIAVLSRGSVAIHEILQTLVLDLSAMGVRHAGLCETDQSGLVEAAALAFS
ncbi:Helicase [Cupriavidus taiwanensis]|uniref:helicase-related protein n=1 Tax=Cupriavidus taiwanensis TaxID=164546 RepID=UPI000E122A36|nr:helicase-related protein [Cupriavidus taiwanensis]SPA36248.1 Helicase [Cupriavidus taiwanensis]